MEECEEEDKQLMSMREIESNFVDEDYKETNGLYIVINGKVDIISQDG